jgi:D-3-phosphoglycerate dehydrogenase
MKCLVIDVVHESLFEQLEKIGWEADYRPEISRAVLKSIHHAYDGLIVRSKTTIDRDLLGENPKIKFVGRAGAGLDMVDVTYLTEKGIHVLHASEGNRDAVGEFTVGALLSLMRNIPRANTEVRDRVWAREENRGEEIMDKTVGIVGYGNMGQAFARRLKGFSCRVLAYDKYKPAYADDYCDAVTMETLEQEADILSLHVPLTHETLAMADSRYFARFRKPIIIINTARGEIVRLSDLENAMASGQVRGAVLDVLENEKLDKLSPEQLNAFNLLCIRTNVIFTPHIAGWTVDSHVKINVALTQKIKALQLA